MENLFHKHNGNKLTLKDHKRMAVRHSHASLPSRERSHYQYRLEKRSSSQERSHYQYAQNNEHPLHRKHSGIEQDILYKRKVSVPGKQVEIYKILCQICTPKEHFTVSYGPTF